MKKCENCARWNEPLKTSACYMPDYYDPNFFDDCNEWIENGDGTYHCVDFKEKSIKLEG
ncbi:hypothetical protein NVP1029O_64 [Vibrio phage 1.029.O._10N.261.55.A7]|nr:hypothetical protein NVP1029O_64 [Vibrio phage 1.029.O._10N.261.55.A7]